MEEEKFIVDSISPNRKWAVVFEDNGDTGYLYLCDFNGEGINGVVDHLWIYNQINPPIEECQDVFIIWSQDSSRVGLIVDNECWGIMDLDSRRKLFAPRKNGSIRSIPKIKWDHGLDHIDGEELRI